MYWPMALCASLYFLLGKTQRVKKQQVLTAGMMASAWIAAVLPWTNELCTKLGYWSFHVTHSISVIGLPLSLYIGWILLWGFLPAILAVLLEKWHPVIIITVFFLLDVITMPYFSPVMTLSDSNEWLIGELLLVIICLTPAIYLSRWVIADTHVGKRATLISSAFILIILTVLPMVSPSAGFHPIVVWMTIPTYQKYLWIMAIIILSLPGIAGVTEFARVGKGTPIPYDPPKRLITTGVYMYVRNPMQLSMVLVVSIWAIIFTSWLMLSVAIIALIYCIGLAKWSESCDLKSRYGEAWIRYSQQVKSWKPSILPTFVSEQNAQLYIDYQCGKCTEIKRWIENKSPVALEIIPASEWKGNKLNRITYHDPNTSETSEGVLAFAKAIQHIHLGWALLAWLISLPFISYIIQAALDASGAAPQKTQQ